MWTETRLKIVRTEVEKRKKLSGLDVKKNSTAHIHFTIRVIFCVLGLMSRSLLIGTSWSSIGDVTDIPRNGLGKAFVRGEIAGTVEWKQQQSRCVVLTFERCLIFCTTKATPWALGFSDQVKYDTILKSYCMYEIRPVTWSALFPLISFYWFESCLIWSLSTYTLCSFFVLDSYFCRVV